MSPRNKFLYPTMNIRQKLFEELFCPKWVSVCIFAKWFPDGKCHYFYQIDNNLEMMDRTKKQSRKTPHSKDEWRQKKIHKVIH
jgi:hypothetical protein